jgi:hypothetical protein
MAKINFDVKKFKELATKHYEVLALVGVAAFAVIFFFWGVLAFFGESSPEVEIKDATSRMEAGRTGAPVLQAPVSKKGFDKPQEWPRVDADKARMTFDQPLFLPGEAGENRRFSPKILALDTDATRLAVAQIDLLNQGVFAYDSAGDSVYVFKTADLKTPEAKMAGSDAVFVVGQKRLVVVSATFPYLEQAELYRKALRLERLEDLFSKGLAPTFEGLNVQRRTVTTVDGKDKPGEWEDVYMYDPVARKQKVSRAVVDLMQTCYIDTKEVDKYYDVIYGSSVTPLPALAGGKGEYPEIKLAALANRTAPSLPEGGKTPKEGSPPVPPPPGGNGFGVPGAKPPPYGRSRYQLRAGQSAGDRADIALLAPKDVPLDLKDQLNAGTDGKFNWFSPYGTFADEELVKAKAERDKKAKEPPAKDGKPPLDKPPPFQGSPGGPGTGQQNLEDLNYKAPDVMPTYPKALVRFVDAGVAPGMKYQYRVQVRFANPNFGLAPKYLAQAGLARYKELASDWVETASIAVPPDYLYYITNQERKFHHDPTKIPKGVKTVDVAKEWFNERVLAERLPFEIFKFVDTFDEGSTRRYVADWVCAERLLVGRGEILGRDKVETDIIVWNKTKGAFELGGTSKGKGKGVSLIPVDFRPERPIYLLDFVGGKHAYRNPKSGEAQAPEESAAEALLLMPDGTMIVRNSRSDMTELEEISPLGPERLRRWTEWKKRLEDMRTGGGGGPGGKDKDKSNN